MQRVVNKSQIAVIEKKMIITTEYTDTLEVNDILQAIESNKNKQAEVQEALKKYNQELQALIEDQTKFEEGLKQILNER